jgi:DNA-binding NtrC family response regulator
MTLEAMEKQAITEALARHRGNRTRAARELGIDPSTLYRKIKALGISPPESDGRASTPVSSRP